MTENLRPLTQEQRQSARRAAQKAVVQAVGVSPDREHFSQTTITKYPAAVTRLIASLCLLLLLAAFTPSAIRLYVIGSHTFGQSVSSHTAQIAVGLATVLSAEIGQVVSHWHWQPVGSSVTSEWNTGKTVKINRFAVGKFQRNVGKGRRFLRNIGKSD